jgi:polar amino acid transport system substrate-binding protein
MKSLVVAAAFAVSSLFPFISHAADKPLSMHADLHAQLPEKIRSSKTLNLVTDAH